jgi:hypothetical protein
MIKFGAESCHCLVELAGPKRTHGCSIFARIAPESRYCLSSAARSIEFRYLYYMRATSFPLEQLLARVNSDVRRAIERLKLAEASKLKEAIRPVRQRFNTDAERAMLSSHS